MAQFASDMAESYSETAPHVSVGYERNSVALIAGADALDRVDVLERELAEARKPCPCRERDARIDEAMEEN
jgi:hypothetical protein